MKIPIEKLSPQTIQAILEEFVSRDGTDYGLEELSLQEKVEDVKNQIDTGKVILVFDEESQSCNLIPN